MSNALYCGDNLTVLREQIADESVDLAYLDPPFHPAAGHDLLLHAENLTKPRSAAGNGSFQDSWHWNDQAARSYEDVVRSHHVEAATMLKAMRAVLGQSDMMASLAMMAVRLIETRRVLKPSGSLYLHADPVAGHYLKILTDAVFGPRMFRTEIAWQGNQISASSSENRPRPHGTMLSYVKSSDFTFHPQFSEQDQTAKPVGSFWTDIHGLISSSREAVQKPIALLDRIIAMSSNEGDVVLDPFCGTGTTLHAAQRLNRRWIGIDVTHLAISTIACRLKDAFPEIRFAVHGVPQDIGAARDLVLRDKRQFQWWAVSLVDAAPRAAGTDGLGSGSNGIRWLRTNPEKHHTGQILVSATGSEDVGSAMLRDLKGEVEREKALGGLFITLTEPTREMRREAAAAECFETSTGRHPKIQILTVGELLAGTKPNLPSHALAH